MGWTGSTAWKTKADVVKAIKQDYRDVLVRSKVVPEGIWLLARDPEDGALRIVFVAIECYADHARSLTRKPFPQECMYKDIPESAGPTYYDVPLAWFKEAPVVNAGWRKLVHSYRR